MIEAKETLTGNLTSKQVISGGVNKSTEKVLPELEDITITPTKQQQVFNHENSDGYDNVTVNPIPDEYIIPEGMLPITENTTYDVRKYARVSASVHPAPYLQDKEVTITENGTQNITFDDGYDGLNSVEVTTNIEGSGGTGIEGLPYFSSRSLRVNASATNINNYLSTGFNLTGGYPNMMIVYGYASHNYTVEVTGSSAGLTILKEKQADGFKLFAGYIPLATGEKPSITINQSSSGTIALGHYTLSNCGTPAFVDDVSGSKTASSYVNFSTDGNLNLYIFGQKQANTNIDCSTNVGTSFDTYIGCFPFPYKSNYETISWSGTSNNEIIHISCPFQLSRR